jgi:hypothetical protein
MIVAAQQDRLNTGRVRTGLYGTTDDRGFQGLYRVRLDGDWYRILADPGDETGWGHVSVSPESRKAPPSWRIMCEIRRMFWGESGWVTQFHPPAEEYVNNTPTCLHLWQYVGVGAFPTPDALMVGVKGMNADIIKKLTSADRRALLAEHLA